MSANLNAPALTGGQANPETTVNDAVSVLDAAVTETLVVDLTNNVTLTSLQYRSAVRYSVTPAGVTKSLTLPLVKRLVYISNDSANAISLVQGSVTIALAAAAGGFFYTDGTANGLKQLASSGGGGSGTVLAPYDLGVYVQGAPLGAAIVMRYNVVRAFSLPIALAGSVFNAGVAATGAAVFTIKNNGSSIGTLSYAAAGTVPTVSFTAQVDFAVNDVLTIVAPGSADATLANISFNFAGTRPASTAMVPFDMGIFIPGKPAAAAVVLRFNAVRAFVWKASLTGSVCNAGTASAASAVFTIKNNGSTIGTVTFSTSATGTISFTADVFFAVNDVITIVAPTLQDTTLADVALNFLGSR